MRNTALIIDRSIKCLIRNFWVFAIVALYFFAELVFLFRRLPGHYGDLSLYYRTATRILDGQVPFQDFPLEYPFFALIPIVIPQLINTMLDGGLSTYIMLFAFLNIIYGLVSAYVLSLTGLRQTNIGIKYLALIIFSLPIYLFRFDPFPVLLTSFAIFFLSKHTLATGATLFAGVAAKIYPSVFMPVVAFYYFFGRRFRELSNFLVGIGVILVLLSVLYVALGDRAIDGFLQYHWLRGIHIESFAGGIILFLDKLGMGMITIEHNFGAYHLKTEWSESIILLIKFASLILFTFSLISICYIFNRDWSRLGYIPLEKAIWSCTALIILFLLLNKVFSPQYMIWIMPFIPFCGRKIFFIYAVALALTVLIFPGYYHLLLDKQWPLILLLNLRNLLLIWLLGETFFKLKAKA